MKPHGLKGEVTVSIDADFPDDFKSLQSFFIEQQHQLVPYFVTAISQKGNKAFVKLEDVDTIDQAEQIAKCALYLPRASRPKAKRGEFYNDEIVGFEVIDSEHGSLGVVLEVIQSGPQRFLSLNYEEKEMLIPVDGPFITSVNRSKSTVSVQLPEGFLDI